MKQARLLSLILVIVILVSLFTACKDNDPSPSQTTNSQATSGTTTTSPNQNQPYDDNQGGENDDTNDDNVGGENIKIDLPDDYVITMADMERFLLTKDEQYPITNEYVELYQQESGGYIANAIKAGLTVDKAQHLPSQKWHYFESWLYPTIEEGLAWDAPAASKSYSNFACPELLLWIIEATGVDSAKVTEAKNIAIEGKQNGTRVQTICASIRAAVPFNDYLRPLIIEFLENNPVNNQKYTLTVNTDSSYQISGLKTEYMERETVSFSILMNDNTKEIDKVTANGTILAASNGVTYKFSMPAENVEVVITLKDKESVTPSPEATKDYYYDIVYTLPGKTAKAFESPAEAYNVIKFNGTKENIISSVSNITNVYGGGRGGSGDNLWYAGDMLKIGTTSVNGSITIELTKNVTGVIITGYVTDMNCKIRVGDSSSTVWSGGADDGKTTLITAKDDYYMHETTKQIVEANNTSSIQINFESTNSVTIATENKKVLYITSIEFIVDETK